MPHNKAQIQAIADWLDNFQGDAVNRYTRARGKTYFDHVELRRFARLLYTTIEVAALPDEPTMPGHDPAPTMPDLVPATGLGPDFDPEIRDQCWECEQYSDERNPFEPDAVCYVGDPADNQVIYHEVCVDAYNLRMDAERLGR